jgi:hypothetical protein
MRTLLFIIAASFIGCGTYGLEATDTGAMTSSLGIDPLGEIDFGGHDLNADKSARKDVVMFVDGEQPLAIIDIFLEGGNSEIFKLSEELPLPIMLQPGVDFPVSIRFSPHASGTFRGELTVMIDDGTTEGAYINRPLVGEGCTESDC